MHGGHRAFLGLVQKFLNAFYGAHERGAARYVDGLWDGGVGVGGRDCGVRDGAFLDAGICSFQYVNRLVQNGIGMGMSD